MRGIKMILILGVCLAAACAPLELTPASPSPAVPQATPTLVASPAPTATPVLLQVLSAGQESGAPPAGMLTRLGEYYRSDPVLACSGGSPRLRRSVEGGQLSPAVGQLEWCACNLRGSVSASLTLPDGTQRPLESRRSLAYSTCYAWTLALGPQAPRGVYALRVSFRDGELLDRFQLGLPQTPQALWLEEQNLIWAGGFQPGETLRALVFSAPAQETLSGEGAYSLEYSFQNTFTSDPAGEVWINPGSPAVSSAYRLVILDAASGRTQAGRGIPPLAAQILAGHIFNNCANQAAQLRIGSQARAAQPLTPLYLSSLLLDDEVLEELEQGEEVNLLDGPLCDQGGWRWRVSVRKGALHGWMPESSLTP